MKDQFSSGFLNSIQPDEGVVRKSFKPEGLVKISPLRRFRAEILARTRYRNDPIVRVPQVYDSDMHTLTVAMERVEGQTLIEALKEMPVSQQREVVEQTGEILRAIHRPVATKASPEVFVTNFLSKTEEKMKKGRKKLQATGYTPGQIMRRVRDLVDVQEAAKDGVVWVHRDFSIRNVLYNKKNRHLFVIDWEEAGLGVPYEDALITERLQESFPEIMDAFWQGYGKKLDQRTLRGYSLGILAQLLTTADALFLRGMSRRSGVDMRTYFANSIKTLMQD